jgi:hypothetical protein
VWICFCLVGCGVEEVVEDTAVDDPFARYINLDATVETGGDIECGPTSTDWGSAEWLVQPVDASLQGQMVQIDGMVEDFETDRWDGPHTATVDLWYENEVDPMNIDFTAESDSTGVLSLDAPACQPTAYRVSTDPALDVSRVTYKKHQIYPYDESGIVEASYVSVSRTTYLLIPAILNVEVDEDKAVIAGAAYDCMRQPTQDDDEGYISGAQVIVYDSDGNIPDSTIVHYFNGDLESPFPSKDQPYTNQDGLWTAINVPPGDLRVELWGNRDGELTLLGATELQSEANSINIAHIYAGYGDGVKWPEECLSVDP